MQKDPLCLLLFLTDLSEYTFCILCSIKYTKFISQWYFLYVISLKLISLNISYDIWTVGDTPCMLGFVILLFIFVVVNHITWMSMYQWLKLYDGLDRRVWREEECKATDHSVLGREVGHAEGALHSEYVAGSHRFRHISWYQVMSTTSIIPEITSTHSTCTLPMPSMFVIQTQELFLGWEILLAWCSVCLIDNGQLRISCTFYKSLFLNRNVIKLILRINLLVCCFFVFCSG